VIREQGERSVPCREPGEARQALSVRQQPDDARTRRQLPQPLRMRRVIARGRFVEGYIHQASVRRAAL